MMAMLIRSLAVLVAAAVRVRRRFLPAVSALVAALVVVPSATAQANASSFHDQTTGPNAGARHCVINWRSGGGPKCFTSFRAAIRSATGGRVTDAPNDVKTAMASRRLAAELNQAPGRLNGQTASASPFVLGVEYVDSNWQGYTLTITGTAQCTSSKSDVDAWLPSLSNIYMYYYNSSWWRNWDNEISSFVSYSNCLTKLFENNNFGGASYGWADSPSYVGDAMNDQASSIQFS